MFRKNLTKWYVLATYNQSGNDYVVFFRKNLKTGMMYFKTKSASNRFHCAYNMEGKSFVPIEETFNKILAF
jgi:hypothetical protein